MEKNFIDFGAIIEAHEEIISLRRHKAGGLTGAGQTEASRVSERARADISRWLHSQYKTDRGYKRLLRLEEAVMQGNVYWNHIGVTIYVHSSPTGALIGVIK